MTKLFEIINRICRKQSALFIGGICLTGLCFGTQLFSETAEQHQCNITPQYQCAGYGAELPGENVPLYGQGVMFFDRENQVVRKTDAFVFGPSNPTSFDNQPCFDNLWGALGTEPKKLQFYMPGVIAAGVVADRVQPSVPQPALVGNSSLMMMAEQANATFNQGTNEADTSVTSAFPAVLVSGEYLPTNLASTGTQTDTQDRPAVTNEDQNRHGAHTMTIAMHWPEIETAKTSIDTGKQHEQYVTQEQFDDFISSYQLSQNNVWGRQGAFTITPYGYINVSTSYESERTVMGDFALYSRSPDLDGGGHSGFHIDPKSSRLGLKIDGPALPVWCHCVKTSALFEIDFQGANFAGTRNRGAVMMRRAFVDFIRDDTRLLIGQEWDVVSPLVPQSLNYVPGSYTGNVGYRRAQIRLERTRKWNSDFSTKWQVAVCDNVPNDYLTDSNVNIANSGWPMIQGRIATTFGHNPLADCQPYTVGISGHIGEMTHDYMNHNIDHRRHESWSANLDVDVPVTNRLRLTTEIYTGTNLSPLLAGIGQGVDLFSPGSADFNPRSAEAYGGWANLNFKVTKKFEVNSGYCVERMTDMIGSTSIGNNQYSARDKNQVLYLNGIYHWTDDFLTGLEMSRWRTDWHIYNAQTNVIRGIEPGETTRIDFLMRYSF